VQPLDLSCLDVFLAGGTTECDGYLFFDLVHVTEAAHSLIAAEFTDVVQPKPVPLPAGTTLLATGRGLILVGSRRASWRRGS
jgi:hypothetical protein